MLCKGESCVPVVLKQKKTFLLQRHCAPLAGSSEPSVQRHMEEDPENSAVQLSTPAQLCLHLRNPRMDKSILNWFTLTTMLQQLIAKLQSGT